MERVYERCCGLDVHKKRVVACLRTPGARRSRSEVRTFGTSTGELLRLADWLTEAGCTHVAMESTGVYWKPVFNVLEGVCEEVGLDARSEDRAIPFEQRGDGESGGLAASGGPDDAEARLGLGCHEVPASSADGDPSLSRGAHDEVAGWLA